MSAQITPLTDVERDLFELAIENAVHDTLLTEAEGDLFKRFVVAPELYEMTALLERCIEYDIRRSESEGDDEGANLKRLTLAQVRDVLAKARGEQL